MKTLYVRNVPDEVAGRLEQLAEREGTSVNAVVIRYLESLAGMMRNAEIFDSLPDLDISTGDILQALDEGRSGR